MSFYSNKNYMQCLNPYVETKKDNVVLTYTKAFYKERNSYNISNLYQPIV